jgi:NAD(P)-dependent dehydrogenase (short-subunit alcohol dehydrogenase family)
MTQRIEDPRSYVPKPGLLDGRVILVTGAGKGIGRALALRCGQLGATVVLLGRTVSDLESVYDDIVEAGGPTPGIFVLDFERAGPDDYAALQDALRATYGRLDGLVQNASILGERTPIEHYDVETWQRVLHVNLTAPFILTRYCMDLLKAADDASIIFTSSGVGREGRAYWGAYSVSKFGVEALSQILAEEHESVGKLRFNAVNPGGTRTAMRAKAYPGEDPDTLPRPEDILPVYLYLLGPDSRGVSGKSLDAQ